MYKANRSNRVGASLHQTKPNLLGLSLRSNETDLNRTVICVLRYFFKHNNKQGGIQCHKVMLSSELSLAHPDDVLYSLSPHQQPGHLPHLLAQHHTGHNVTDGLCLSLVPALSS